ncbi:hypothetical protein H6504_00640 [Candidatus Woesearchaeota archaeon]|nr:hypothetical protein [Candidatus Woesearchaeota archaeon]
MALEGKVLGFVNMRHYVPAPLHIHYSTAHGEYLLFPDGHSEQVRDAKRLGVYTPVKGEHYIRGDHVAITLSPNKIMLGSHDLVLGCIEELLENDRIAGSYKALLLDVYGTLSNSSDM